MLPQVPFPKSDRTCQWLVSSIDEARDRLDFDVWAYVFMPTHVHLLIRPKQTSYDISEILTAIKQPVSRQALSYLRREAPEWLPRLADGNARRSRYHFWQPGGGFDRNVTEPDTLLKMIDYIHLNPVRKGLVSEGRAYCWSSCAWYEGLGKGPLRIDPLPPEWAGGE